MEDRVDTNRELAQDYFSVATQYSEDWITYNLQKRRITKLQIDLPSFYREHGSFEGLNISGIGKKTKGILELILEKGVEEARRIVVERKIESLEMEKWPGRSKAPRTGDDVPPSWDDSVGIYESR